jgi:hypothetical protein
MTRAFCVALTRLQGVIPGTSFIPATVRTSNLTQPGKVCTTSTIPAAWLRLRNPSMAQGFKFQPPPTTQLSLIHNTLKFTHALTTYDASRPTACEKLTVRTVQRGFDFQNTVIPVSTHSVTGVSYFNVSFSSTFIPSRFHSDRYVQRAARRNARKSS